MHKHYFVVAVNSNGSIAGYFDGNNFVTDKKHGVIFRTENAAKKNAAKHKSRIYQIGVLADKGEKVAQTKKPAKRTRTKKTV